MLTQKQIDFFHGEGYLIMRGMYQGEELRLLQRAADVIQAQGEAKTGADHLYTPGPDGHEVYWRSEKIWMRSDIFKAVTVKPEVLENIGQCLGHSFYPWNDSLVVKLARRGGAVNWHQDPPYMWGTEEDTFEVPNFTTDIYLDHSGPDNGCVYAIHGHHLVGSVDLKDKTHEGLVQKYGAVPIEMEAGDVLFHCLSTPHGSAANNSDVQRRIFYIHYLSEVVYKEQFCVDQPDDWTHSLPGWGDFKRGQVQEMIAARVKLGWDSPLDDEHLVLDEGGFEFTGNPTTPPRHWKTLRQQISEAEKRQMKTLKSSSVEGLPISV